MKYLVLFPEAENVHLIKDVGMIPYSLHKFYGYDATLLCAQNGKYPYLDTEVKGLKLQFLKKKTGILFIDSLLYIFTNAQQYQVFQTFHFRLRSLIWLFVFKIINPSCKSYLKLDANETILDVPFVGLKGKIKKFLLNKIDIVSVETAFIQLALRNKWNREIELIPNGFSATFNDPISFVKKKNKIITVGRIGAPEKRNELLLEAFVTFHDQFPDWELALIGPIVPEFNYYIEQYFLKHPHLKNKVLFTGAIENRKALFEEYAEAKIFCLTSKYEGFCISLVEAASAGCFLISSSVISAPDITANEKYGRIFPIDDLETLKSLLCTVAADETLLQENCSKIQKFANAQFSWEVITHKINELLKN